MKLLKVLLYVLGSFLVFVFVTSLTIGLLLKDESSIACPDITGLDLQEAKRLAEQNGLSLLIVKYERKKDIPYNRVLVQKPEPSMPVKKGRAVSVVISDGPKPMNIPALLGRSMEEGETLLREQGIRVKKVIYVPSSNTGKILAQVPGSGENILDEEGMVLIVGGREKRYYVMPDITTVDYAAVVDEMDKKQIKYTLAYGDRAEMLTKGRLQATIPPRSIFNEDDLLEIRMNGGG